MHAVLRGFNVSLYAFTSVPVRPVFVCPWHPLIPGWNNRQDLEVIMSKLGAVRSVEVKPSVPGDPTVDPTAPATKAATKATAKPGAVANLSLIHI